MCYTLNMQAERQIWQTWAHKLHCWGLADLAIWFFEVVSPLSWIAAQALYFSQPLFARMTAQSRFEALLELFEEPEGAQTFIEMLRKGTSP